MRAFNYLSQCINMHYIRKKYPTCKFYGKAFIENSILGKYNTFFDNVFLFNSFIDDFTYIQKNTSVISAEIGKFCSIAAGVRIGLGSHPIDRISTHPAFYSASQPLAKTLTDKDSFSCFKKTYIGHDVWIGENALVKDGVNINTGAVIGAGAVVTKDIPAFGLAVGVPARVIKYRFGARAIEQILKTEWWNQPAEWFAKNIDLFESQEKFLEYFDTSCRDKDKQ